MKKYGACLLVVFFMWCGNLFAGQLITVVEGMSNPVTVLKKKEHVMWWNRDKERVVTVVFSGDMKESNFSTANARFLFTDGHTLTSNLIPPGGVMSISFENGGEYAYVIYGLPGEIHGKISVE